MPAKIPQTNNQTLSDLPNVEAALLWAHLEAVPLPIRRRLEIRNRKIEYVYFPESGFASVVADGSDDRHIEVGIIGREGMTGLSVLMGADSSPNETYMQVAGAGYRMPVDLLRRALSSSHKLHWLLLEKAHAFVVQAAQTALVNGRNNIEERLARWLLLAQDRLDSDVVPLTHEFLAIMLGVQRPGVTLAINTLHRRGVVAPKRGKITILDRDELIKQSRGAYGTVEANRPLR